MCRCSVESARLHFLGGCLRYDTDSELLSLLSTDEVAQLLTSIANANAAAASASPNASNEGKGHATSTNATTDAPFPDEATLQELEERRVRRARVRAARLASNVNNEDNFLKTAVIEDIDEEGNDLRSQGRGTLSQQTPTSKNKRTVSDLREAKKRSTLKSGVGAVQAVRLMGGATSNAAAKTDPKN